MEHAAGGAGGNPSPIILLIFGVVAIIVGVCGLVLHDRGLSVSRTEIGPFFAIFLGVCALFLSLIIWLR